MLKHIIAFILISLAVVLFASVFQHGLDYLLTAHAWTANQLKLIFSGSQAADIIRQILALFAIPLIITLIPVAIYWFAKRGWLPWAMEIFWIMWFVQTALVVMQASPLKK